jgi:hypothetical protein
MNVLAQAIERLRAAGFDADDDGVVTSRERGKWGTLVLSECELAGEPRVHSDRGRGKTSGKWCASVREALGELYA